MSTTEINVDYEWEPDGIDHLRMCISNNIFIYKIKSQFYKKKTTYHEILEIK